MEIYGTVGGEPLSPNHVQVIKAIYSAFQSDGEWPKFITIDRPFRHLRNLDTAAVIKSIPESLLIHPGHGLSRPAPNEQLRLTLYGIALCENDSDDTGDASRFVDLLRWFAELEMSFKPSQGSAETGPRVSSEQIADFLGMDKDDNVGLNIIYAMLDVGDWGITSTARTAEGWSVTIGPEIWRFRDVQTISDCITVQESRYREEKIQRLEQRLLDFPKAISLGETSSSRTTVGEPAKAERESINYISKQIVESMDIAQQQAMFECSKLSSIIAELNDNCSRNNTYASHALLRTLLDHIPPVFGFKTFAEVANNYRWSQTDKSYMKRLAQFRDQADDALHRMISSRTDVLEFDDMPPRVYVNRLLQECISRLRDGTTPK